VILSGPLCAGKSTLAAVLAKRGWSVVTARSAIEAHEGRGPLPRRELQRIGLRLESDRPGLWLSDAVCALDGSVVVVDAARTRPQVGAIRDLGRPSLLVFVSAPRAVRRSRFTDRADVADAGHKFDEIADTPLERGVEALADISDLAIDTTAVQPVEGVELILSKVADVV
jgi:hypothetical protein